MTRPTTITVGGKQVSRKKLIGGDIAVLRVPLAKAAGQPFAVAVDRGAHVSVRLAEAHVDAGAARRTATRSRATTKTSTAHVLTSFKAGQLVHVKLTIIADANHRWIAVTDPLPAGFEIIDPKLGDVRRRRSAGRATRRHHWLGRDDVGLPRGARRQRALVHRHDAGRAATSSSTTARATIAGTFVAMPATVEAMYAPDVHGRTDRATIT